MSPGLQEPHKEGCLGEEQGEAWSAVATRSIMNCTRQRACCSGLPWASTQIFPSHQEKPWLPPPRRLKPNS